MRGATTPIFEPLKGNLVAKLIFLLTSVPFRERPRIESPEEKQPQNSHAPEHKWVADPCAVK